MSNTATTTEASISVQQLRKRYDGTRSTGQAYAVEGVSFDVPKGQFLTLLGPSGCGKTTTLRCIAGLEQPTGGRITMAGRAVYEEGRKRPVPTEDRPIAMVPQSYGIWPHMTVLDNAAFALKYGRNRKGQRNIRERALEMLDKVGLTGFADRWATQLSGGQQQRLALARALISDPEVLLLDEPLSNLDAKLRAQLRVELRRMQEQFGVTTVYVTHDQSEALAMSDTVVLMNGGKVEQIDNPQRIYERPASAFAADFIGSANLVPVEAVTPAPGGVLARTAAGSLLCAGGDQSELPTSGGYVCIRPEAIEMVGRSAAASLSQNELAGRVIDAEYLGDQLDVVIAINGSTLKMSTPTNNPVRPTDEVVVRVAPERARYLTA